MEIYELNDYKEILRIVTMDRRNQFGLRFTFEKIAQACGIQKTYLSKVLNGSGHLNADQLYSACEFLKLSEEQTEFILLVRELQLAQHKHRKKLLAEKLTQIRAHKSKTHIKIKAKSAHLETEALWEYYSDPDAQLVHVFLTIPRFVANPFEIGSSLGLSKERLMTLLFKLEQWGLITSGNGKIVLTDVNTHLPDQAALITTYRIASRLRALDHIRNHMSSTHAMNDSNYSMSAIFSADAEFQKKLRSKILELVEETHRRVRNAEPEDVYQLNIDCLKWS